MGFARGRWNLLIINILAFRFVHSAFRLYLTIHQMPKVQGWVIQERLGEIIMLGIFIAGFAHTIFVELVNSGARVANEHRRVSGYQELGPAAFVKLVYDGHKGQYP